MHGETRGDGFVVPNGLRAMRKLYWENLLLGFRVWVPAIFAGLFVSIPFNGNPIATLIGTCTVLYFVIRQPLHGQCRYCGGEVVTGYTHCRFCGRVS